MVFTQRLAGCKKLTITQFKLTGCRINPANPSLMSAVGRRTRCPMNRLSILFFRSICSIREYSKPRLGGVPRSEITCPQEPLAAAAFIVQNGRAWFCMTHPATAVDRAEIGRRSQPLGKSGSCHKGAVTGNHGRQGFRLASEQIFHRGRMRATPCRIEDDNVR